MTADCVGGVWNHALTLARGLQRHGCVIHLVVFGQRPSAAQRKEVAALENVRCIESDLRLEWMDDPWDDLKTAAGLLAELIEEVEPMLLHLNGYALAARAEWRAPIVVGAHSCVLSWWDAVRREPTPRRLWRYREEVAAGLAAADAVVAPTNALLTDLRRIYDVDFQGTVIRNGIDPNDFALDFKCPEILSAGRLWDEAKNIQLLDSIARNIAWPILVAGDAASPTSGGECRFENLRTLGKLTPSTLRQQLSRTSIYAAPALYEPFGLAVLEAALSGCALVLADIPSFRELWHDAALLIDPSNACQWEEELNRLISDPEARTTIAEKAYIRGKRFNCELMSERYYTLYRGLIAGAKDAVVSVVA